MRRRRPGVRPLDLLCDPREATSRPSARDGRGSAPRTSHRRQRAGGTTATPPTGDKRATRGLCCCQSTQRHGHAPCRARRGRGRAARWRPRPPAAGRALATSARSDGAASLPRSAPAPVLFVLLGGGGRVWRGRASEEGSAGGVQQQTARQHRRNKPGTQLGVVSVYFHAGAPSNGAPRWPWYLGRERTRRIAYFVVKMGL